MLSVSSNNLLVIPSHDSSQIVVLPLSRRDPRLHHKATPVSSPLIGKTPNSLDLLESPSSCFRNEEKHKSDRQEPPKGIDKPDHRSQSRTRLIRRRLVEQIRQSKRDCPCADPETSRPYRQMFLSIPPGRHLGSYDPSNRSPGEVKREHVEADHSCDSFTQGRVVREVRFEFSMTGHCTKSTTDEKNGHHEDSGVDE